jgi:phage terminase small subunit
MFVREYLKDLNATQAAIRAGYSKKTAIAQGSRLLTYADVREAIEKAKVKRNQALEITAERVVQEMARLALVDIAQAYDKEGNLLPIHEIPEDTRRALSGVEVEEMWGWYEPLGEEARQRISTGRVRKVKFNDKARSLELLAKHMGLLKDTLEITGKDGGPVQVKTETLSHEQRTKLLGALDTVLGGPAGGGAAGAPGEAPRGAEDGRCEDGPPPVHPDDVP